ncbi:MAG: TlpA family protein disulfide reductase [Ignavibacteriae bacterium]|nr:MAG: TlpA family protein disulfide reductase [Ignavibacteriota bacterium]
MKQTMLFVISMILLNIPFLLSQDIGAKTSDGQSVILRKNGNWFFLKPSLVNGKIQNAPAQDTKAVTANGQIVILKKDGTWIITNQFQKSVSRISAAPNPKVAGLAKNGHWVEEHWELHQAMLDKPAPGLVLTDWMNGSLPQESWRGKIVVVDFWATWCGPCKKSIPHNNELSRKYKDRGVVIIGACGSNRGQEHMEEIVQQSAMEYPTGRVADNFTEAWNVRYWPTYALVDRSGTLRAVGVSPDSVEKIILALLEEDKS